MTTATTDLTAPQSLDASLRGGLVSNAIQQALLLLLFAGLAVSRADGHVLGGAAIAGIVVVAAGTSTAVAWTTNLYSGAFQVLTGGVAKPDEAPATDVFATARLWRTTILWCVGAAAWAGTGAGLVAAVLNGRLAGFAAVLTALVCLTGVQILAISNAARRVGVESAAAHPDTNAPLRRRAWVGVALPYAISQGLAQAGLAWLLFHAYPTGNAAAPGALTDSTALADALILAVSLTVVFGGMTRYMGAFDAATGRVFFDDVEAQTVPARSPIGVQFMVYAVVVGLVLAKLGALVLPSAPTLAEVIVVRGVMATVLVFLAAGLGYVRGAVNGLKPNEVAS